MRISIGSPSGATRTTSRALPGVTPSISKRLRYSGVEVVMDFTRPLAPIAMSFNCILRFLLIDKDLLGRFVVDTNSGVTDCQEKGFV